ILDSLTATRDHTAARVPRGELRYVFDRAHNELLDHVLTGGLVGAWIWITLLAGVVVVGVKRLRASADEDWTLRLGCLGAVGGHLVERCFGIETAVPSVLFWMSAGMLTAPPQPGGVEADSRPRHARALWTALLVG